MTQELTKAAQADCVSTISPSLMQDVWRSLTLAMAICDATPTLAHETDGPLRQIGLLVNNIGGVHGYAFIRDTLAALENALTQRQEAQTEREAPRWTVSIEPVAVSGETDAHCLRASIGNQSFHIGPDYMDTKQEAEFFAEMFLHAIEMGHRASLPAPQQATPEQDAESAGLESANGHLSVLLNESTQMLAQLRAMVGALHEQWSNGGPPERNEFPLLDRVDDWLNARPVDMVSPERSTPEPTCMHPSWSVDKAGKCTACGKPDAPATPEPIPDETVEQAVKAAIAKFGLERFARAFTYASEVGAAPEPVAEVKLMESGGNAGIATVIREIDNPLRERLKPGDKLYTRPAPVVPEGWREVIEKMIAGIDHLAELARQWEPDYSSGADRRGWVLAKNARDEAFDMLAAAQAKEHGQ